MIRRRSLTSAALTFGCLAALLTVASPADASHSLGHHWSHDGLARSQIYFVDHTGPSWPVATTVYKWNEASGVDSYYQTSCPGSTLHCVHVRTYSASDGIYGVTYFPNGWNSANHNREGVHIALNNHTVNNATQARKTTCQEEGHVLGLDHRFVNSSCLMQGNAVQLGIRPYPDSHDYNQLHSIYDHNN